ncbi:MAG: hypothetical protein FWE80_05695 [Oscillospiraceae bacterium]|nr:hypothetical protein [Oscillospiraceae bacterium]
MDDNNQKLLAILRDIYAVSAELGLKSYVWGGFAADILHGAFTREHRDLDCFTENLTDHIDTLKTRYEALGYTVNYLENFWMLQIYKDGVHAAFNCVKNIGGIAHWYHAGRHGTVFFPFDWLDKEPLVFYGARVYTIGVPLLYILKTNVRLLHAEWQTRDKDLADIALLEPLLASQKINIADFRKKVWSHNPIWYANGYEEYYYPITLK